MHICRICTSVHIHKHPSIEIHLFVTHTYIYVYMQILPLCSISLESLDGCRQDGGEKNGLSMWGFLLGMGEAGS